MSLKVVIRTRVCILIAVTEKRQELEIPKNFLGL